MPLSLTVWTVALIALSAVKSFVLFLTLPLTHKLAVGRRTLEQIPLVRLHKVLESERNVLL